MSNTYTIRRVQTLSWDEIPQMELSETGWLAPTGIRAWAQVCHDGENLYVRMTAEEAHIRAEETETLAQICDDSCLEFFLAPDPNDARYLNFEWNPLGNLYLGFGAGRATRVRQIVGNKEKLFAPKTFFTKNGWGVEYRVPVSFIRMYFPDFAMQGEAAGNFYKCGDRTKAPHYLAWNPLTSDKPDYHRRMDFGQVWFA